MTWFGPIRSATLPPTLASRMSDLRRSACDIAFQDRRAAIGPSGKRTSIRRRRQTPRRLAVVEEQHKAIRRMARALRKAKPSAEGAVALWPINAKNARSAARLTSRRSSAPETRAFASAAGSLPSIAPPYQRRIGPLTHVGMGHAATCETGSRGGSEADRGRVVITQLKPRVQFFQNRQERSFQCLGA